MEVSAFIKSEHVAGWEYVAQKNGAESVEAYAQAQLDNLGASYEAQRKADDAAAQQGLFDLALQFPEDERAEVKAFVLGKARTLGLIPKG